MSLMGQTDLFEIINAAAAIAPAMFGVLKRC